MNVIIFSVGREGNGRPPPHSHCNRHTFIIGVNAQDFSTSMFTMENCLLTPDSRPLGKTLRRISLELQSLVSLFDRVYSMLMRSVGLFKHVCERVSDNGVELS